MNKVEKEFLLDGMTWSFSRVNSYETCPRMWLMEYLECMKKSGNAFAEWGSHCHSLFERYYKGELEHYQLADVYEDEYDQAVSSPFPFKKMADGYYANGLEFFSTFEGQYQDYEVVGVEKKVDMDLCGRRFIGYIDLLLKKDDEFYIVDFKSKSKFKTADEKKHYALQLYLYAEYVRQEYGKYPIGMEFNMFRARTHEIVVFELTEMETAKKWFEQTIQSIYDDEEFNPNPDPFFCKQLCSVSDYCEYGKLKEETVVATKRASRSRTYRTSKRKTRR